MKSILNWHTDTILIAEPDQALREMESSALSANYRIIQISSVEEAVRTAARHAPKIDLLLTEVRLPHRFGWELTELLKLDYPDLKAVYMSSSIDAEIKARTQPSTIVLLENPFCPDSLQQAVRDALETRDNDSCVPQYAYSASVLRLHR